MLPLRFGFFSSLTEWKDTLPRQIILEFTDNRLVDIEGDDIYVFEIRPTVEAMYVAISEDGQNLISVGRVAGNKASLDIALKKQEPYCAVSWAIGEGFCDTS